MSPTSGAPARGRSAAGKIDQLTSAAFALFSTHGIDRVNLDEVASAAGVTKGSLYWHFSSKKEVVLASCEYYYARWRKQITAAIELPTGTYAKLEAAVAYSVRSCLLDAQNRVFSTEVVALSLYDLDVRAGWARFLDETERLFLGLAHRAVGAGELHCDDVDGAVNLMLDAMEGIKQEALFRPHICVPQNEERTCRRLLAMLGERTPRQGR